MKSYVCTIDRATDRQESIRKSFEHYNIQFEFIVGTDWKDLNDEDIIKHSDPQYIAKCKRQSWPIAGVLACWLSHRRVWKTALENGDDLIAVFEDDATLTSQTKSALDGLEEWQEVYDIVFIYNGKPRNSLFPVYKIDELFALNLIKYDSIGAVGYVITKKAMTTLLTKFPRMVIHIDALMHYYWWSELKTYVLTPQVVFHGKPNQAHFSYSTEKEEDQPVVRFGKRVNRVSRIRSEINKFFDLLFPKYIPQVLSFKKRAKTELTDTNINRSMIGDKIHNFAKQLWPINRSITGDGVRETLRLIQSHLPNLRINEVESGTQVFDWVVPKEWKIRDAYIVKPNGEKICDFKSNNLHVVGYSTPVDEFMDLTELQNYLYSLPDQPDAIPYITSYYKERFGFCISENERKTLKEGQYRVVIDSELFDGSLTYGELVIPGKSSQEVFISTYICHPSMANNELSGPTVVTFLGRWLESLKERRFTYRIVFIPETIGSITYLSRNLKHLQKHVFAGFNVSCVGDDRAYSYLSNRGGGRQYYARLTSQTRSQVY